MSYFERLFERFRYFINTYILNQFPDTSLIGRYIISPIVYTIQGKILFPYFIFILTIGLLAIGFLTRTLTNTLQDDLRTRLIEVSTVILDEISIVEATQRGLVSKIRATDGIPVDIEKEDVENLKSKLTGIFATEFQFDNVTILNEKGEQILYIYRGGDFGQIIAVEEFNETVNQFYQENLIVIEALSGKANRNEDKYALITSDPNRVNNLPSNDPNYAIYVIAPFYRESTLDDPEDQEVTGAVLVGISLKNFLQRLAQKSASDVSLFNTSGELMLSTFNFDSTGKLAIDSNAVPNNPNGSLVTDTLTINQLNELFKSPLDAPTVLEEPNEYELANIVILERNYDLIFHPFLQQNQAVGIISIAVWSKYLEPISAQEQLRYTSFFIVTVLLLVIISLFISRLLVDPIKSLVQTTDAVAQGDFSQRANILSKDEIGDLAGSFNSMTQQLEERNRELKNLVRLREEDASKLRSIVTSIADGVIYCDEQGKVLEKNPTSETILTYVEESDQFADVPAFLDTVNRPDLYGQVQRIQIKDKYINALASPVFTVNEDTIGAVVVLRDVTQEVEAERLKDEFIKNVSHELRTPTVVIEGYANLLQMTAMGKLEDKQMQFIHSIKESGSDLQGLITNMLDMVDVESGELEIEMYDVEVDYFIEDIEGKWAEEMDKRQMIFETHISDKGLIIHGDERQLQKIFDHLLDNASKYSRPNGRIDMYVYRDGEHARFDVKDTGVGFQEKENQTVFDRFVRLLHTEFYETRGLGLGLYISQAIAKKHQGKISYQTEYEVGSTFSVRLPLIT